MFSNALCRRLLVVAIALLIPLTGTSAAQGRAEGSLAGTVTDATQAVLPGVTVTATNPATGFVRETVSDTEGSFQLPALPPGTYQVVATLAGFNTYKGTVTITVGSEARVTIPLSVGAVQETLTVTGEAPLVETTQTEQAATFNQNEVGSLPINSRNFLEIALLSPGVVRGRSAGAGWGGENGFSASGNRGDQNGINIDGMVNKSMDNGGEAGNFSPAAVQEFQVVSQSAPAEYGGAAGGVINAVTRSGTNQLSGTGFFLLRHNAFDKPPFNLETGSDGIVSAVPENEADEFQRRVVGFTVGGPLKRDKAFFFGVVDRTDRNEPRVRTILPNTIDLVRQIALPEIPDDESNRVSQFKPTSTKTSAKVDINFSQRHNASFRFSSANNFSPDGTAGGNTSAPLQSVYSSSQSDNSFYLGSASLNSVLSSTRLNTFRFQYNKDDSDNTSWPTRGGLENITRMDAGILISGASGGTFGGGNSASLSVGVDETKWEAQDTFTMFRSNHTMKFGGQYMFVQFFQNYMFYPLGEWRFSDLNAFQAGRPSSFIQGFGPSAAYTENHLMGGFAQDEWQPSSNLTINYGLRYEYNRHPTDLTRFDLPRPVINPETGAYDVTSNGSIRMGGFKNDPNNVAPRFGIAWSIDNRTVVRAGGGMFYGNHYYGEMTQGIQWSSPLYERYDFTSAEATQLWAALRNPASPFYNSGELRFSRSYLDVLHAQRVPHSKISHATDLKVPQSAQASLGVERQLTSVLAAQVSLLWSRGANNIRAQHINPEGAIFYPAGSVLPSGVVTPYDVRFRGGPRPDPDPTLANHIQYVQAGRVRYKGLSTSLTARWPTLQLRAAYSYNDTWDDSTAVTSRQTPADTDCGDCEFSKSVMSTTHNFRASAVYQTPQSWPLYARDWQLATMLDFESGHPFQVTAGFDFNNDTVSTDRPFGVPRNSLWTDGYNNIDLRVARFIPLGGRTRLEVMFEMFNLLNTAHYSSYIDTLYVLNRTLNRYVPRPDFAAFAANSDLNVTDFKRTPEDIGLDRRQRRAAVAEPFQGQFSVRFHF